jgi:hypothetical protein
MKSLLIFALVGSSVGVLDGQSLREGARNQGGTVENAVFENQGVATLPYLVRNSEVVIHAQIQSARTELTRDETMVFTEYLLVPIQTKKNLVSPVANRPGMLTPLVARRSGGVLIEGKYRMVTHADLFPESEAPKPGEEAVLFLSKYPNEPFYYFVGGPYGMFRVKQGHVEAMTKAVARLRQDRPRSLASFLHEIDVLLTPEED